MPGKSNHGKNNTFKLRAKCSFPILAADAASGMLGGGVPRLEQDAEPRLGRRFWPERLVVNF